MTFANLPIKSTKKAFMAAAGGRLLKYVLVGYINYAMLFVCLYLSQEYPNFYKK